VRVCDLGIRNPVVSYTNETLRAVATRMAGNEIDRMPVVDRDDPRRVVGLVSLTMLLAGRLKDLEEDRDTERVLRLRIVRPRWLPRPGYHGPMPPGRTSTTEVVETVDVTTGEDAERVVDETKL
ncbi:MAG: CBS domain-containing protein, partial [Solirubrobacteraceae bacterium]